MVLEKTLESPLDCKEIQPVHSEGDQPWDFFGRIVNVFYNIIKDIKDSQRNEHNRTKLNLTGVQRANGKRTNCGRHGSNILSEP